MRYSAQIRAARALLGWSQDRLAKKADIGLATLRRIEQKEGIAKGNFSTIIKIQKALEQAGIHFTEDDTGEIGVRMKIRTR
ncbi:MAG: helix-turn-helix transcriptional regulator [Xanthobacteraceae bacterium]|jgi:ribosome-binding protein aMBF1 (putative translation factor)